MHWLKYKGFVKRPHVDRQRALHEKPSSLAVSRMRRSDLVRNVRGTPATRAQQRTRHRVGISLRRRASHLPLDKLGIPQSVHVPEDLERRRRVHSL